MEDFINEGHIRGLPEKVDRAEVGHVDKGAEQIELAPDLYECRSS
jgi:hypothetical protein